MMASPSVSALVCMLRALNYGEGTFKSVEEIRAEKRRIENEMTKIEQNYTALREEFDVCALCS